MALRSRPQLRCKALEQRDIPLTACMEPEVLEVLVKGHAQREKAGRLMAACPGPRAPLSAPAHGLLAAAAWRELTSPADRSHLCHFGRERKARSDPRSSIVHLSCCSCCSLGGHPEKRHGASLMLVGAMLTKETISHITCITWANDHWVSVHLQS